MLPTVLFILHLPPPIHGAAMMGKYIHDSEFNNNKFDCHYINLTTAKDLTDIGKVGINKLKSFINLLVTIRKEVKRIRPRLAYVTPNAKGGAFYKDFVVVQMLKAMGCKVIIHYHNKGVATRQERTLDNLLYKLFFKNLKVMLLANALYKDIEKYVHTKDVYICPNGIPDSSTEKEEKRKTNELLHFLFLSNLLKSKGVFVLLDACKMLKDKGYRFVCNFVGGETTEINAAIFQLEVEKRQLNDSVCYLGKRYGYEKERVLSGTDIFIFPTFYQNECFPLVLLEAMQRGLPCISTDEGGIPDIIEDGMTGYIVKKKDAKALAEKMELLMNDKALRKRMGEAGFEKFKRQFTLTAFEKRFTQVLEETLTDIQSDSLLE